MLTGNLENIRRDRPIVHCITNYVTANDCANLLLAAGASPIMADDPEEAEEIVSGCAGLVINMGTPNPRKLQAMYLAGRRANELGIPVVLDPVGTAASSMRLREAQRLMDSIRFSVIRANASEVRSLIGSRAAGGGLDADAADGLHHEELAGQLARRAGCTVMMTGSTDIVTDGIKTYRVHNGHTMMRLVTGAGCQLSALTGAFAAANREDILSAALSAACAMGVSGEMAAERMGEMDGNASFRNYLIDSMCLLKPEQLKERAKYEEY